MNDKPIIGITVGDPASIGPEIVLAAAADQEVVESCRPLLIGDIENLRATASTVGLDVTLVDVDEHGFTDGAIAVKQVGSVGAVPLGVESAVTGQASYDYIASGVELALSGAIENLVTAPISKSALRLADKGHLGHTELLAELTDSPWSLTYFTVRDLRVLFLTRHLSLRDAIDSIDQDLIIRTVERFVSVSDMVGLPSPSIALQAMNPHGGEGGLFGTEEIEILTPAVAEAQRRGYDVHGPVPADSVFALAAQGRYDVVLSLYHDIAAGVCKSIDFHGTVSTTLGLPFLRFSVDHGTAFDIAGKGIADARNMTQTVLTAASYAGVRAR
ncbi:4-hydroxythreonine-4-phosphate dehydrogenase [Georgenia soli]|uniref:4-hydroxythreonine-4-phosphate dehydrogenase n=1 Tax=Georgenia soli TaxID=638953 RepID=A0A2A9F3U4_9MICO|nr:4-hydroxythreonine-4-phosphate dehydrogenase PdxA [Georgenia soli]PFG45125.1 4-hydroxythreonine-4-phosphate dehydrogenase [Georgenia soli]